MSKSTGRKPDTRCFVQVVQHPSIGVEVSKGTPWIGVDQQIGHGSADGLFALTDDQYVRALAGDRGDFEGECWRGEHPDLKLFDPGGTRTWRPDCWHPASRRTSAPWFDGELWWHVAALGTDVRGEAWTISRALSGGAVAMTESSGVIDRLDVALGGEQAYPRPDALIVKLPRGSDRDRAQSMIGRWLEGPADAFAVDGVHLGLSYDEDGLVGISLSRPKP